MKRNELWKRLVAKPPKMRFLVMLMCIFCTFNAVLQMYQLTRQSLSKVKHQCEEALNMVKKQPA